MQRIHCLPQHRCDSPKNHLQQQKQTTKQSIILVDPALLRGRVKLRNIALSQNDCQCHARRCGYCAGCARTKQIIFLSCAQKNLVNLERIAYVDSHDLTFFFIWLFFVGRLRLMNMGLTKKVIYNFNLVLTIILLIYRTMQK